MPADMMHILLLFWDSKIFQSIKNKFGGTVKLIFQPGEEKLPGGASLMIKEGVLIPKPSAVIGQHVMPRLIGKIAIRKENTWHQWMKYLLPFVEKAGMVHSHTRILIRFLSLPYNRCLATDRKPNGGSNIPTVLSFGKLIANGAINVIPDEVYMEGTFRTLDEKWRNEAHKRMKKMAETIAESMGGSCDFKIVRGYPFLINEENLTAGKVFCRRISWKRKCAGCGYLDGSGRFCLLFTGCRFLFLSFRSGK